MKTYLGFPQRLRHQVPDWVEQGAIFHVRMRIDPKKQLQPLTTPELAEAVLASARLYEQRLHWFLTVFVLMPDHLHALVSFPGDKALSVTIGNWKRFHRVNSGIKWQEGYFDHRLRDDERGEQLQLKIDYLRRNPVAAGLCAKCEDWPWVHPRSNYENPSCG